MTKKICACLPAGFVALLALVVALALTMPLSLNAQQFFGTIVGTVSDASGGVIPGARVTLTNVGTNEKHTATSNAAGDYTFVDLVPATYSVQVETPNFKRYVHDNITVGVNTTVRVDAALQVGAATETVEVTTAGIVLQTDSPSVSNKVEAQQAAELPLNGRNILGLLNITPGVIPSTAVEAGATMAQNNGTSTNPLSMGGGAGEYTINGGNNEEYIDGAPINMIQGSNLGIMVTADAIQEFNIDTNVGDASEGRATGGSVNMTAKSGTNNLHWTAYDYFRNADLDANNFFNIRNNLPRPEFNQNLYGFNLGFPVKKDKIFFFGSYEVDNVTSSSPTATNVPSNGNAYSNGGNIYNGLFTATISDPIATGYAKNGTTGPNGDVGCPTVVGAQPSSLPYTGSNIIHDTTRGTYTIGQGCWDPLSTVFRTFWAEQPNSTAPGTNYVVNMPDGDVAPQMNARMDLNISPKQRLFAHTAWWAPLDKPLTPFPYPNVPSALPGGAPWNLGIAVGGFNSNLYILGDTYTFNPKTVLDVRAAWLRYRYNQLPRITNFNYSQLNGNWATLGGYILKGQDTLPGPTMNGGGSIQHNLAPALLGFTNGQSGTWGTYTQEQIWSDYSLNGTLNYIAGKHSLKLGFEARLMDMEIPWYTWTGGSPSFGNKYTGDEWADFLLGYFTSLNFGGEYGATEFNKYQGYFLTDTWQFNRKLTLSLGFRYELPGGLMEKKDSTGVLLPYATDPNTGSYGTEVLVNTPQYPSRSIMPIKKNIVDPRVGFAYRLDDKTVVRGGYGIVAQAVDLDQNGAGADGFAVNIDSLKWSNPTGGTAIPTALLSNPVPNVSSVYVPVLHRSNPNFLSQLAFADQVTGGVALNGFYSGEPLPYFQQYNFTIQRQVGNRFQANIGYVGSHAIHLKDGGSIDEIQPWTYTVSGTGTSQTAVAAAGPYAGTNLTSAVPVTKTVTTLGGGSATYSGVFCSPNGAYCNDSWKVGQTLQPYPNYSGATIGNLTYGNQTYNSLQVSSLYRIQGGGLLGVVYTWAKTMNDTTNNQDYYNHRGDRAAAGVPMRLAFNFNYPLPIGQGQRFLNSGNPVVSRVISGWTLNDITSYQHGAYLTITSNTQSTIQQNFGGGTTRPNYVAGCNKHVGGNDIARLTGWFNTSCYTFAGNYVWGNQPANDPNLFAAPIHNWDIALLKTTKVTEKYNVQLRVETFNTFNHFQPSTPSSLAAGNANFGVITTQANNPRQVQISLRVNY